MNETKSKITTEEVTASKSNNPADSDNKLMTKLVNFWDMISALALILVGVGGIVFDAFITFTSVGTISTAEKVIVFLVSFLCLGLGTERLLTLRKIRKGIDNAQRQVKQILTLLRRVSKELGIIKYEEEIIIDAVENINKVESLIGTKQIDEAAEKLIENCPPSQRIKATAQYNTVDALPDAYYKKIADKLKTNIEMEYQVILPLSVGKTKDKRIKMFEDAEVADRIEIRRADNPFPFEVLIAGESMIIALLGGNKKSYALAVKITDPEFVKEATDWFRQEQWSKAIQDTPTKKT